MRMICRLALVVPLLFLTAAASADDWPQWLGPKRDGVWRESGLVERFPDGGPKVRWRVPVAGGYAGPAVAAGRVFVTDWAPEGDGKPAPDATGRRVRRGKERVLCLRESDGSVLWAHQYDCPYGIDYAAGPRTTPAVDGDRVYTLGAEGRLLCLEVETGKVIWSTDVAGGEEAPVPMWGMSTHPLVDGDKVITLTARKDGVAAAFDKRTGKPLWSALSARGPGYCPPMIFEAAGVRQLVVFHPESVNALDPETGKVYWSVPFGPVENDVSIATPVHVRDARHGDLLVVSQAWDGTMVLKLGRNGETGAPTAEVLSQRGGGRSGGRAKDVLHALMAAPVVRGGHLYGVHNQGQLRCLDLFTGAGMWETFAATNPDDEPVTWSTAFIVPHEPAHPGPGSAAPEGFRAFIANEHGELILAELSPKGYEEISRARLLSPTNKDAGRPVVWCHPAFANRSVYWRNDKELVCASLGE
jgi:outer membrane protein assembly factor BamB